MSELHEVIQEQNRQIQRMYSHLRMLKEGVTMSQNLSGVTVDSGLESVSTVHSSSAPSSMSNVSSEMMMLRNEVCVHVCVYVCVHASVCACAFKCRYHNV